MEEGRCDFDGAQEGDPVAFRRLVEPHLARLESLIRLRIGSRLRQRLDAEDVVQETLLKAHGALGTFEWRGASSFFQWLSSIAENTLRDLERLHLLSGKAGAGREVPLSKPVVGGEGAPRTLADLLASSGVSPSKAMRRDERFERLERSLDQLPAEQRDALVLARVQGVSIEEVARRMGRSRGAVSMLILRALRKLEEVFGQTDSLHLPDRSLGEKPEER